jgi:cellulose synthase (UDP-forming)
LGQEDDADLALCGWRIGMTAANGARPYAGQHRVRIILPAPPDDTEKYSYIDRQLPYLAIVMMIGFVSATLSQLWFEAASGWWPFAIFTFVGMISFGFSLPLSFVGRGFDLDLHNARVRSWQPRRYPHVDIFLPICGEPIAVLANTWAGVRELMYYYPGVVRAYVLDDGADPAAERLAAEFAFRYVIRPNQGENKKSGNLRYAFAHTQGEFIVILDADFVPRADFLAETLPYMDDASIAIVQTPQFFRTDPRQTWVERAAGAVQEVFYRSIQVARDRVGASICVGSCAVYRRAALDAEGGTTLIAYAEDVHTGLDARRNGWNLVYVPLALATGMCPDNLDAFVRQQYRWCTGSTSTILTSRLWTVPMSLPARLTYVSGFCYYLQTALATFAVPLIPICLLTFRPLTITPENSRLILIALAGSLALVPLWNRSAYAAHDTVPLTMARGWAHALAIWDYVRGKPMAWQASGAGVGSVRRFHLGTLVWNGSIALAWLALAVWRTVEFRSWQFVVVLALGSLYAVGTARILAQRRVLQQSDFRHTGGRGLPREEPSGRRSPKPSADGAGPFRGWVVPPGGTVADSPNERREVTVD